MQQLPAALGLDGRDELRKLGMTFLFDQRYACQGASPVVTAKSSSAC
jgi:hypothetical protein